MAKKQKPGLLNDYREELAEILHCKKQAVMRKKFVRTHPWKFSQDEVDEAAQQVIMWRYEAKLMRARIRRLESKQFGKGTNDRLSRAASLVLAELRGASEGSHEATSWGCSEAGSIIWKGARERVLEGIHKLGFKTYESFLKQCRSRITDKQIYVLGLMAFEE